MQPDTDMERFATLDFETSNLSRESWPIEVGLSWLGNGEIRTWSTLIRPAPAWNLADWARKAPLSMALHRTIFRKHQLPAPSWMIGLRT